MKTITNTSVHETNTSVGRYDLSSFQELFEEFIDPGYLKLIFEELRLYYLQLSLSAEQAQSIPGNKFPFLAHKEVHSHCFYLSEIIERLDKVCEIENAS